MSKPTSFTQEQIANWWIYEEIRLTRNYNMLDRRAREDTDLSREDWVFCMDNYTELRTAAEAQGQDLEATS